jgi:hypothetical protein
MNQPTDEIYEKDILISNNSTQIHQNNEKELAKENIITSIQHEGKIGLDENFEVKNDEEVIKISLILFILYHQLPIKVSNPIVKDGIKAFVIYTVTCKLSKDPVMRRFSDFYSLRAKLTERWPGVYIPNIPPKKAVV